MRIQLYCDLFNVLKLMEITTSKEYIGFKFKKKKHFQK